MSRVSIYVIVIVITALSLNTELQVRLILLIRSSFSDALAFYSDFFLNEWNYISTKGDVKYTKMTAI
jgi:hypothetical protein